jgi:predicted SprT family Zn-dependent metalloprotease
MRSFGLDDWSFGWNRRVWSMGLCRYSLRRIELSVHLVQRNPAEEVMETLLHEVAHALTGAGHGHDRAWRAMCVRVGCRPVRCGEADMPEGRWRATCGGCGATFRRHRRPRRLTGWNCRRCGRERGRLAWVRDR